MMKITVLTENTACKNIGCAHGLSLYIETAKHKILFDAGPKGELLLENAKHLGIDLTDVDIAILSHGHYDHAGGLKDFLDYNKKAKLYMQKHAPEGHFAYENIGFVYIGVDPYIMEHYADRIIYSEDVLQIDEELLLFSDIKTADFCSGSNGSLQEGTEVEHQPDRFLHEQNLIVREGDHAYLIAGCAHRGVINILRRAEELIGTAPDAMFSGFHLTNPGKKIDEPQEMVEAVGRELKKYSTHYYTGHCTGKGPYGILKEMLGDQVEYMSGGAEFLLME